VFTGLPKNTLVYSSFLYDGATGGFLREQPPLGKTPSFGASLVGLMYPLHFGNFAGAASKAVWAGLGFAAAYVTLTGMLLWTRRREEQVAWQRMARVVHYVGYGLPLALACAPYAFFALRSSELPLGAAQNIAFLAVAAIAAGMVYGVDDLERARLRLLGATGIALAGLPLMRLACDGPSWGEAWRAGLTSVPAVDGALIIAGATCLWVAGRARRSAWVAPAATERSKPEMHVT
jgi:hypothetical protein